jgi:hypothetical protein
MSAKVYVVQEPPLVNSVLRGGIVHTMNLEPAQKFGALTFLLTDAELRNAGVRAANGYTVADLEPSAPVVSELRRKLTGIQPTDYLLLVGDPVIGALAMALALHATKGRLRVLRWLKASKSYSESEVVL